MSGFVKGALIFIVGVGVGVVGSKTYFEKKYNDICNEEIKSVKETFENLRKIDRSKTSEKPSIKDVMEYSNIVKNNDYASNPVNTIPDEDEDEEPDEFDEDDPVIEYIPSADDPDIVYEVRSDNRPESIDPENFGDIVGYRREALNYYLDGVFADDSGNVVENVDETIGLDNLKHFDEYETGALFIRNDAKRCYYEVYLDKRNFSDVCGGV